jgi:hypothetical protein
MKVDLEIYRSYFFEELESDDEAFLKCCGQQLNKKPWRSKANEKTSTEIRTPGIAVASTASTAANVVKPLNHEFYEGL